MGIRARLQGASGETGLVTQFAKDEVEAAGLVKFDFLGLKTLTVIQNAIDLINRGKPAEEKIFRPETTYRSMTSRPSS